MSRNKRSAILGTAGHIDHGKTALVKALTGTDTDRLKEEKRRGITIELGFAHLEFDNILLGIVDVPGHERFIKSMVAGAGGIDMVMLVVAADEGVMPQTREHLDVCHLLGIKRGFVALNKIDLVDSDWSACVIDDLRSTLAGTFLEYAPIVPCSAITQEGIEQIRQLLKTLSNDVPSRDESGHLRLPLDRVFTMKGFGTVVTGTLLSGTIQTGDPVVVLPAGATTAVRRIQVHGETVQRAYAGQRTAVNLGGIEKETVARGDVLSHPDTLALSFVIDTKIRLLPNTRQSLKTQSKVLFHLGTRQQGATCTLLGKTILSPGDTSFAQLRFERPIVALPNDHFILRSFAKQYNYGTTIGGGIIIRTVASKIHPSDKNAISLLEKTADSHLPERVALEVLRSQTTGLTRVELQQRLNLNASELTKQLNTLLSNRTVIQYDREKGLFVHQKFFNVLQTLILQTLDQFHKKHPLAPGIDKEELRSRLGRGVNSRVFMSLLDAL
ncbi:MAG: selenocysteine-specific translation elongation factor, partial [Pseudomonadota bacterium]